MDYNEAVSIIIPTYNESKTVLGLVRLLRSSVPRGIRLEIVIVDDNSPDGTGRVVREYIEQERGGENQTTKLVVRATKRGLSSAILTGIRSSMGRFIVVMDADFSHPPSVVPSMIDNLISGQSDVVVASRNVGGGRVIGWPLTRRIVSRIATDIAKSLGLRVEDPMSGFFAFDRKVIEGISFDAIGYKLLPEILAKSKGARVREIPYTFTNRRSGESKLSPRVVFDYLRMSWRLYWVLHWRRPTKHGRSKPQSRCGGGQ